MSKTPFSDVNKDFSEAAHTNAKNSIYPKLFSMPPDSLSFEVQEDLLTSQRWSVLDGELAIDRIVKVTTIGLRSPIEITVQERFRKPQYQKFQDITITEHNNATNETGELYKLKAHYFVYGYYDKDKNKMLDAVAVNIPSLLVKLANKKLVYSHGKNTRSNQDFIGIKFADLRKANLMEWEMKTLSFVSVPTKEQVWEWIKANSKNLLLMSSLNAFAAAHLKQLIEEKERAA